MMRHTREDAVVQRVEWEEVVSVRVGIQKQAASKQTGETVGGRGVDVGVGVGVVGSS